MLHSFKAEKYIVNFNLKYKNNHFEISRKFSVSHSVASFLHLLSEMLRHFTSLDHQRAYGSMISSKATPFHTSRNEVEVNKYK